MDASTYLQSFNDLANRKPFEHFKDHPTGTTFKVVAFSKCTTKFGLSVVVETENQFFHLPARYLQLFDTDEKLTNWNNMKNLNITYDGLRGKTILIHIHE